MSSKVPLKEQNKFEDRSNERAYFSMIPRIVWAYCRNPYDYILWGAVRDIAGENGECYLSTQDLAVYCMVCKRSVKE